MGCIIREDGCPPKVSSPLPASPLGKNWALGLYVKLTHGGKIQKKKFCCPNLIFSFLFSTKEQLPALVSDSVAVLLLCILGAVGGLPGRQGLLWAASLSSHHWLRGRGGVKGCTRSAVWAEGGDPAWERTARATPPSSSLPPTSYCSKMSFCFFKLCVCLRAC